MSCGGRIYKGDSVAISIPFDVSGYTDLTVSYFTIGDTKIVRDESGLTVADGYITAEFSGHDLDLLPDGVLRFTLQYKVDDVDFVDSSNTMLYLKTPESYSAKTEDDVFEDGFDSGVTEGFGIGYESGVTAGYSSGHTDGYSEGFTAGVSDTRGRMATTAITANGVYERGDGFNRVEVDVPLDTPCNIDEGKEINMANYFPYYQTTVAPESGYAGLSYVSINASGVYNQGVNDVKNQFVTLSATTNGLYLPQSEFAVFKEVYVNVDADCSSAITEAYQSGLTAGAAEQKSKLGRTVQHSNGTFTTTGDGWSSVTVNVQTQTRKPKLVGSFSSDTAVHGYDVIDTIESIGFQDFIFHVDNVAIGGLTEEIPAGEHTVEVYAMNETDVISVVNFQYWRDLKFMTY